MSNANEGCLQRLVRQHSESRKQLDDALKLAYPQGMRVVFLSSSVQQNPSFGVVTGTAVDNHPYVLIRGDSGKRQVAWISLDSVLTRPNVSGHQPPRAEGDRRLGGCVVGK